MKLMILFLSSMIVLNSISCVRKETSPVYESPVIVKNNGLTGQKGAFSINREKMVNIIYNF